MRVRHVSVSPGSFSPAAMSLTAPRPKGRKNKRRPKDGTDGPAIPEEELKEALQQGRVFSLFRARHSFEKISRRPILSLANTYIHCDLFPKPSSRKHVCLQPFPVPIASLTDVPPSNAIWRWYRGKLDEDRIVVDEGEEDASNLSCMGFFGERRQPSG